MSQNECAPTAISELRRRRPCRRGGGRRQVEEDALDEWEEETEEKRREKDSDRTPYPARYSEWQLGNRGSSEAAPGGQSREQAGGLSSAPLLGSLFCSAANDPLPPLPFFFFRVSFFFIHFACPSRLKR